MSEAIATNETTGFLARRTAELIAVRGVETVVLSGAEALGAYLEASDMLVKAPAQSARWTQLWRETVNPDLVVAILRKDGRTLFALALEVVRKGPMRIARFPGGSHANGNFPPTCRAAPPLASDIDSLIAALRRTRPDIDLLLLERLTPELLGLPNPLLALPHGASADVGLAVNLDGGFDGVMGRASGKRKRKKHRSQQRKFEAVGEIVIGRPGTMAEAAGLLDIFFTIKGDRLKRLGVDDVFADAAVRQFFKRLFGGAAETGSADFVLEFLSVGGKIRAITGSSLVGDRVICEFSAITYDDLSFASPGEFLFYHAIDTACAERKSVYDFSVGDEAYKRLWCDIETTYADIRAPFGFKGALLAAAIGARAGLVRRIKASRYWPWLKKLRRREIEYVKPEEFE